MEALPEYFRNGVIGKSGAYLAQLQLGRIGEVPYAGAGDLVQTLLGRGQTVQNGTGKLVIQDKELNTFSGIILPYACLKA